MLRRTGLALSASVLSACSLISLGGLSGGDEPPTAPDASDATSLSSDANADGMPPAEAGGCDGTGGALPVTAFDMTPAGRGPACNLDDALRRDGRVAGLDRAGNQDGVVAGESVNGCLGVDFGPSVALGAVTVRMAAVENACGTACLPGTCATGREAVVIAGPSRDSLRSLQRLAITPTLTDYSFTIPADLTVRIVVVCRLSWGEEREDVAVDAIAGTCR